MKIHFSNGRILSENGILHGDLITEDGKILYLGPPAEKSDEDRYIDLQGNLLLPGFKITLV